MIIDDTGLVGIGTDSPESQFHVTGSTSSNNSVLQITDTGTGTYPKFNDIKGGLQASWKFLDFGASRKKVQASQSKVRAAKYNINYQTRIDEVERLRLLSLISSLNKQLKEQYDVLEDINRQIMLMETQLTSSKFLGISLADLFYQKINIKIYEVRLMANNNDVM